MSNRRKPTMGDVPRNGRLILPRPDLAQQVPDGWADEPRPSIPDNTQEYVRGMTNAKAGQAHNAYVCDDAGCRAAFHTIDRHPGVTPSSLSHKVLQPSTRCTGRCWSEGYPLGTPPLGLREPTLEWYRPSTDELASSSPQVVEHVMLGGLLLRAVTP